MSRIRKKTRRVLVRDLPIGGDSPIVIQSMTSVPIEDIDATIQQVVSLNDEGASLVRLALRNEDSIQYLKSIREKIKTPLSADVHFNYKIAIESVKAGIDKIRINPGNIKDPKKVKDIVRAAKDYGVPIRIGVNGGSVDLKKYDCVTPENLVSSAMDHIKILEDNDFFDIVVSIKSSDLYDTIEANKIFSDNRDYPLHIGLTEAGYGANCIVQSSIAIGHLFLLGIGDTIRVSMTGNPIEEVIVAKRILESVGERNPYIKMIACPTCGRTSVDIDILEIAKAVEEGLRKNYIKVLESRDKTISVAVMGCEVNGPGEAGHADIGVAGGRSGEMLLFAGGRKVGKIKIEDVVTVLIDEVGKLMS